MKQALAHLIYAVMQCDRKIHTSEMQALQEKLYNPGLAGGEYDQMEEEVHRLKTQELSADQAFRKFEAFYKANGPLFDTTLKTELLALTAWISSRVNSVGKSELIYLTRLKLLFDN